MSLSIGTRLGPYEILSALGAGGMGEVWRARDTRLGREVAIKVLPAAVASDPQRLKRFEIEARSASSLNHPAIVAIYDVGCESDVSYIAMELVRGRSLRERLAGGSLSLRELLQLGAEIAEGLSKAHASGIVHRDLKPENVMITEDGHAKILDFGLAKLTQSDGSGREQALTMSATDAGTVVGTAAYMSPEQALGGVVDFHSDQFSLGAILYEMATRRRAFQRGSVPQTMSAIIQDEPEPIGSLNPRVSAALIWLVERCLAKEPRQRYAATEDLALDLITIRDRMSDTSNAVAEAKRTPRSGRPWRWIVAGLVVAILTSLGLVVARLYRADFFWQNPLAGATFTRLTDWEGSEFDAAVSRDGKLVTFLSDRDGPFGVWVTQVGSGNFSNVSRGEREVLYIEGLRAVGFADDDAHVRMRVDAGSMPGPLNEATWLVPTLGGTGRPFLGAGATELDWSPDGARVVYHTPEAGDPFFVSDRSGSAVRMICRGPAGVHQHFPKWSPDGRYVYFVRGIPGTSDLDIWRVPSSGGESERLTQLHTQIAYLAFLDARTLLYTATRADGETSGLYAMDVEHRIPHEASFGLEEYLSIDSSGDGRRLVATVARPDRNLWVVPILNRIADDGAARRLRIPSVRASAPRFGPDFVLYRSSRGGPNGLWKFKAGQETEVWNGADGLISAAPAVSQDGRRVCFVARTGGRSRLYVMEGDGASPKALAPDLDIRDAPSFSPDGRWIAIVATEGGLRQPLFRVPVEGGIVERLVDGVVYSPVWSPDGRFIVYGEGHEGRYLRLKAVTLDRRPYPIADLRLSKNSNPFRFTPDGKALIVLQGETWAQDFWRLDLATERLTRLTKLTSGFATRSFDISPDGKEILFDRVRENADLTLIDPARR